MDRPFIVMSDGFDKELFARFKEDKRFDIHPSAKISQDELQQFLPRINGLVIRSATTVNAELVARAPNLKYVIRAGEGTDNIDKKLCQQKGIKVSNTPGANANSAAEQAVALMMSVLRKTPWAHASMKAGKWEKSKFESGLELWNKTVGLVGFGRIGQIVAQRVSGFEPKVLFYDPVVQKCDSPYATKVSLEEIFDKSDIISIHTPLLDATKNMVNASLLGRMKKTAILINAARGGIVNENDLYAVLKEGRIRGAGFDVFATEPLPADSQLLELDNLVLTPHLGASTDEAQIRVGEMALEQLVEFFINGKLLNEVRA